MKNVESMDEIPFNNIHLANILFLNVLFWAHN